ncbi:MAG: hypothetical protein ISS65_08975 [Desulfobacterales bacterium]|uniref:Uncharacterized protein n=1 Tax=Candidatus Desulfatibia profunda TaxID=2841695 RepID=A0A8J6THY3_9BACT|nr:hypothetical protein [Candidatus Desulfatibia profunda]MBL7180324.1 hypothetical protein [Desulfobacterales bacterium]
MGKLRIFKKLFILFLILGIFANGVMAETCFCGEACLHNLHDKAKTSASSPFHNRCSGTHCKSCNFEDGQTIKAAKSFTPSVNVKNFDTTFIISVLLDCPSTNHVSKSFGSFYSCGTVPFLPIYLKTLSLLC